MPRGNPLIFSKRRNSLSAFLKRKKADCVLIKKKENIFYLSGLSIDGSILAVTSSGEGIIFSSPLYKVELSQTKTPGIKVIIHENTKKPFAKFLAESLKKENLKKIGAEDFFNFQSMPALKKSIAGLKIFHNAAEDLRQIKDVEEIILLKKAAVAARGLLSNIKSSVKAGIKEDAIAFEIKKFMLERHRAKASLAFDILVTSGRRAALPHGLPSSKKIKRGEGVLIDVGIKINSYNSDLTRMLSVGRIADKYKKIIEAVKDAQRFAIEKVKPGAQISNIDKAARGFIERKGYGRFFIHSTGHGIGLEVHEGPVISSQNKGFLKAGMVFTVEPGIYIPGVGGARVEDMVLVTKNGFEVI